MRRWLRAALAILAVGAFLNGFDGVRTADGDLLTVYVLDMGNKIPFSCATDAAPCIQAAINSAIDGTSNHFMGTVMMRASQTYIINSTLTIGPAKGGTFDCNNSTIKWNGGNAVANQPVFYKVNNNNVRVQNCRIFPNIVGSTNISTVFMSTEDSSLASVTSTQNQYDHIIVDGISGGGLQYVFRWLATCNNGACTSNTLLPDGSGANCTGNLTPAPCCTGSHTGTCVDNNNDQNYIANSQFYNISQAAFSLEHTQTHDNKCVNVSMTGVSGATASYGLYATGGSFTSYDGDWSGFTGANEFIASSYGPGFLFINQNSENSARWIDTPSGAYSTPFNIGIEGGRFSVYGGMASDGRIIRIQSNGTFSMRGPWKADGSVDGVCAGGTNVGLVCSNNAGCPSSTCTITKSLPTFYFAPLAVTPDTTSNAAFDIADGNLNVTVGNCTPATGTCASGGTAVGSNAWDWIVEGTTHARLDVSDMNCVTATGKVADCSGYTSGIRSGGSNTGISYAGGGTPSTQIALTSLTPQNGTQVYCQDCNSTCTAGSSTGNICTFLNGAWTH